MTRLFTVLLLLSGCSQLTWAASGDTACLNAVRQKRFVFHAEWATSYSGDRYQLSPPYTLLLTEDSVSAYLPYFGRMYTIPTPEELRFMSIQISSKAFSYKLETGKRGRQNITVDLKDQRDVRSLSFTNTKSCSCTLWVRSTARDLMIYEGTIEELPQ